jgi:hypothetical protein
LPLRDAGGFALIGRGLVGAEQGIAAAARGEVDVDQRTVSPLNVKSATSGLRVPLYAGSWIRASAAGDVIDPVGIVEIAVADVAAGSPPELPAVAGATST